MDIDTPSSSSEVGEDSLLTTFERFDIKDASSTNQLSLQPPQSPVLRPQSKSSIVASSSDAKISSNSPPASVRNLQKIALFPYLISGYVNLAFSVAIAGFWLYLLHSFVSAISSDIDRKVQLFSEEVLEQIARCSRDYRENRCDPATRVPAAVAACVAWEQCMSRDPYVVAAHTKLTAETIGESLNAFFDALTWKTIVCVFLLSVGLIFSYNVAGSVGRDGAKRALAPSKAARINNNSFARCNMFRSLQFGILRGNE